MQEGAAFPAQSALCLFQEAGHQSWAQCLILIADCKFPRGDPLICSFLNGIGSISIEPC
jgi:hypothetical protein